MNKQDIYEYVTPSLEGYLLKSASFYDGQFGDLERLEFEVYGKIGTIDVWSKGWLNIDIVDIDLDKQIMNVLLSPEEAPFIKETLDKLKKVLLNHG